MPGKQELVRDLMTPDPVTRSSQTAVSELAVTMQEVGCRHLPIVDRGCLVGIISSNDLCRVAASRQSAIAADVMTREPLTIGPDERIEVAAATMALRKVSALPVLEDGHLIGIVTTYDVLDAFARRLRDER